jgi:hypothetical protein
MKNLIKKTLKYSSIVCLVAWALVGSFKLAQHYFPRTVYAQVQVEVPIETNIPVLDRIIQCESGGHQTDKTGQVLIHVNSDNSVDIGEAQINSVWFKTATTMGYDLTKEKDNLAFARWIVLNKGTGDYYSSRSCWNR